MATHGGRECGYAHSHGNQHRGLVWKVEMMWGGLCSNRRPRLGLAATTLCSVGPIDGDVSSVYRRRSGSARTGATTAEARVATSGAWGGSARVWAVGGMAVGRCGEVVVELGGGAAMAAMGPREEAAAGARRVGR